MFKIIIFIIFSTLIGFNFLNELSGILNKTIDNINENKTSFKEFSQILKEIWIIFKHPLITTIISTLTLGAIINIMF